MDPEPLTPVTQHLAVWDVERDAGWVALYGEGCRPLTWTPIENAGDFEAIVSMLSDGRGLCFDSRHSVVRWIEEPPGVVGTDDEVGA
jgi:hypothetical protein